MTKTTKPMKDKRKIKYFIEHKKTHLWWYPKVDYDNPLNISTYNGGIIRNGYRTKDGWTMNPNHRHIAFPSSAHAQEVIDRFEIQEPKKNLIITEHEFVDIHKKK